MARRIMSMKNTSDTVGNRTRILPNFSAVPQSTALQRVPSINTSQLLRFLRKTLCVLCEVRTSHSTFRPVTVFRELQLINPLTPNDLYMGRTAPLTSKRCILYIYSTNIGTEYFKHALYCPFFFVFKMQFVS